MTYLQIPNNNNVKQVLRRAELVIQSITGKEVKLRINKPYELDYEYLRRLKELVCDHFQITWEEIESNSRSRDNGLMDARHVYMYIAHKYLKFTLKEVARHCKRSDHTTTRNAIKKIEGFIDIGEPLARDVITIKSKLFK